MSFFQQSSHWYQLGSDGNLTPQHDYTLRDARKHKAFPSITTILKERANPMLDMWKMNQLFDAVVNNPKSVNETEEQYKDRIGEIAGKKGKDAADFGTRLHDALDQYPQLPLEHDLRPFVEKFGPEYDKRIKTRLASEIMLHDPYTGVAGRTDLVADTYEYGVAIIDYKTSKFKKGKASFWDSYRIQLAFYAHCYQVKMNLPAPPTIINVGINSLEPDVPQWKVYTLEEQEQAYREYLAIAFLWFSTKDYWPKGDFTRQSQQVIKGNDNLITA
jgi:hypothetical protein